MDVIGVGGIDFDDNIAPFSSRGMTTWVCNTVFFFCVFFMDTFSNIHKIKSIQVLFQVHTPLKITLLNVS